MYIAIALPTKPAALTPVVSFSHRIVESVTPREDDLMVINLHIHNWSLKRVLIDPNSLTYIL